MEPDRDPELSKLLREWKVGDAPPSLEERVLGRRRPWWHFLFSGYIRGPVPVGLAVVAALVVLAAFATRQRPTPMTSPGTVVSLKGFQPVKEPAVRIIRSGYANQ